MTQAAAPPAQAMPRRVLLSWSSGKDSAWTLHQLRQQADVEIVGLLTTINSRHGRVAMHATRLSILEAQDEAVGLPLYTVELPWPCPNSAYENAMSTALHAAQQRGTTHIAFGDLFLEDVRDYRIRQLDRSGLQPLFPLWGRATAELARHMVDAGLEAILSCVDPRHLPRSFAGRRFDHRLLDDLPAAVDPCGENGEFHTCVLNGPMFRHTVQAEAGEIVERDGFCFAGVLPRGAGRAAEVQTWAEREPGQGSRRSLVGVSAHTPINPSGCA